MTGEKEMTTLNASVGSDAGRSLKYVSDNSIPDFDDNFNGDDEISMDIPNIGDPGYLPVISMKELYNSVYQSKPPIIKGLLYPGTYLFVGAPKQGKSFLMLQLAYHVSTGTPLWDYEVRQGTVLYLALEDDHPRLQSRLYRMFGTDAAQRTYSSPPGQNSWAAALQNSWKPSC